MSPQNKKLMFGSIMTGIIVLGLSMTVQAQTRVYNPTQNNPQPSYTLLEPLPCIESPEVKNERGEVVTPAVTCGGNVQMEKINFQEYVQYAFNLLIALAAVAAVFMIVWGGFQYMSSDSYSGKSEGLNKLKNAVYGLLLVLCSYLILQTIDPRLVQIPTTLVKPLDIEYRPSEVASWMQQIASDAAKLRSQNMTLINQVAETARKIKELEQQKKSLNAQLGELLYDVGVADNDPRVLELRKQIASITDQQNDLQVKDSLDTATGLMNATMQKCYGITTNSSAGGITNRNYGNGYSVAQCVEEIAEAKNKYAPLLEHTGNGLAAQKVRDYGVYSTSMARINGTVLTNMHTSPNAAAFVDSLQTIVTTAGIGTGAVYGGVAGAAAGAVASQFANAAIKAGQISQNNQLAKITISEIQLEVNNNARNILDEDIRKIYTAQAYTLIKSLGGKGDGTDTTANAISNKSLQELGGYRSR